MFKTLAILFGLFISTSSFAHGTPQCDQRWIFVPGHYDSYGHWVPTRRFYGTQCWNSSGQITAQYPAQTRPHTHYHPHHYPRPQINIRIPIRLPRHHPRPRHHHHR